MFQSVRRYAAEAGIDDPVVCYQGAVVAEPTTGEFLRHVPKMKERFGGRLFISKSLPYFLEFAAADVSKGSGLAFLAEHLGFAQERTVGIGDGENDRELLDWAGYGIAVENAHPDLKLRADAIIPGPEDEGVAALIETYLDSRQ